MSRTVVPANRSQQALQSYLDALLQEATFEETGVSLDEFEAAVREEQARDAQRDTLPVHGVEPPPPHRPEPLRVVPMLRQPAKVLEIETRPVVLPTLELPGAFDLPAPAGPATLPGASPASGEAPPVTVVAPLSGGLPPSLNFDGRPGWAEAPFECLLFDVAGLTLAVPLICLGSIHPLEGHELTPLFGQPDWFLGLLPSQSGNLKVLDTARWVMPDRYRDDFRQGLRYVISVQGYEWGLAVHQVSHSIRLSPDEVKWRSHRTQRPWLAGTVIEHMCALMDVAALAELIASGAIKRMGNGQLR
jgi:purine-binding chemotaxis protein CheW